MFPSSFGRSAILSLPKGTRGKGKLSSPKGRGAGDKGRLPLSFQERGPGGEVQWITHLPSLLYLCPKLPMPAAFLAARLEESVRLCPFFFRQSFGPHGLHLWAEEGIRPETLQLQAIAAVEQGIVSPVRRFEEGESGKFWHRKMAIPTP
jgi:hypothetical protein